MDTQQDEGQFRFWIVEEISTRISPTTFQFWFDAMRHACDMEDVDEIAHLADAMSEDEPLLLAVHRWLTSEQKATWKKLIWNYRKELYPYDD